MAVWRIAPGGRGLGMGRLFEACLHLCELAKTSTDWNAFGDLSSERVFGHSGASGTVAWADPQRELVCVILTTRPWRQDKGFLLRRIGNVVQGAIE